MLQQKSTQSFYTMHSHSITQFLALLLSKPSVILFGRDGLSGPGPRRTPRSDAPQRHRGLWAYTAHKSEYVLFSGMPYRMILKPKLLQN
ncbi:hypothetical protein CDAR_14911 [Caerostris darwini]|uniref:Ycf15 n=1 Tax=Caerostris darwini TaxID=1538125 RepID=A0AAV4W8L6_9ARAC|nr:hypothetical protein CDAR_14911 [Caerostris darwini]